MTTTRHRTTSVDPQLHRELKENTVAGTSHDLARARGDERFFSAAWPAAIGTIPEHGEAARAVLVFQRFQQGRAVALRVVTLAPNLAPEPRPVLLSWRVVESTVSALAGAGPSGSGHGTFSGPLELRPSTEWEHFTPGTGPAPELA